MTKSKQLEIKIEKFTRMKWKGNTIAIWDTALTKNEINALSKGTSPLLIKKDNLLEYYNLLLI